MVRSAHFLAKLVLLCLVDIFEILQLSENKKKSYHFSRSPKLKFSFVAETPFSHFQYFPLTTFRAAKKQKKREK